MAHKDPIQCLEDQVVKLEDELAEDEYSKY